MYEITLLFSVIAFVAVCIAFVRSSAFSLFHPLTIYLLFHGLVFVVRPLIVYARDYSLIYLAYQFYPTSGDKIAALLVSVFGMLVFTAACWSAGNVPMQFKTGPAQQIERKLLIPTFVWVVLLCAPIGIYSLLYSWNTAVDQGSAFVGMIRDAKTGKAYNEGTNGYLYEAQLLLAGLSAVLAWLFRFRVIALVPLILFVLYRGGTGGRGPMVIALMIVLLFYLYDRSKRLPSLAVLAVIPLALSAFTLVGDDRGAAIRRAVTTDASSEIFSNRRTDERFLEGMDFANLEFLEYLVYVVPQRSGTYGYFNSVLQVFTEPVPRAFWQDKPNGPPFERINMFEYGQPVGMTRSLPGEGWFSLGWLGVAIWCGLWGGALGLLYRRFVQGAQSALAVAAYMVFLPLLIVTFRDGQLVTLFRQGLFFVGPIALWWALATLFDVPGPAAIRAALNRRAASLARSGRRPAQPATTLPPAVIRRRRALRIAQANPGA